MTWFISERGGKRGRGEQERRKSIDCGDSGSLTVVAPALGPSRARVRSALTRVTRSRAQSCLEIHLVAGITSVGISMAANSTV
jgi:hypothetical protein